MKQNHKPIIYNMDYFSTNNPIVEENKAVLGHLWPSLRLRKDISFAQRNKLIKSLRNGC